MSFEDCQLVSISKVLKPVHEDEVLARIEQFIVKLVRHLSLGEDPTIPLGLPPLISFNDGKYARRACVGARELSSIMQILSTSYELLRSGRTVTQREVYYLGATYFQNQKELQSSLARTTALLRVPRHALNILAASRGWVAGCLKLRENTIGLLDAEKDSKLEKPTTHTYDANGTTNDGWIESDFDESCKPASDEWTITQDLEEVPAAGEDESTQDDSGFVRLVSGPPRSIPACSVSQAIEMKSDGAVCIIVVEKECIFRRLVEDRFWIRFPCILVTGSGFPDVATRAFVWQMHEQLKLPILGLCDYNPFGMAIILCYRNGSRLTPEANAFKIPINWLGMSAADVEAFGIPESSKQPLTKTDIKKASSLLRDPIVMAQPRLAEEARIFLDRRVKVELEGIMAHGLGFLAETYLPTKLAARSFIAVE